MNADLQGILDLSIIDQEIFFLRKKQHELPNKIVRLKNELATDKSGASLLLAKAEGLIAEKSRLDIELLELREALRKSEDKLMQIKTNEEYDAAHSEISSRKAKIIEIEHRLAHISTDIETANEKVSKVQNQIENEDHKALAVELASLESENSGLESQISAKEDLRKETVSKIGEKVLSFYSRMYNAKKTGMHVGVVTDKRRTCGVCGCRLTAQRFIEVKRNAVVVPCEICGSILVWQKDVVETVEPLPEE